jgi:hypothetical protein
MKTLEPRHIPPFSFIQWWREAFNLIKRDLVVWFITGILFCIGAAAAKASLFLSCLVMLTFYFLSVCLAEFSDKASALGLKEINTVVQRHFSEAFGLALYQLCILWSTFVLLLLAFGLQPQQVPSLFFNPPPVEEATHFLAVMQTIFWIPTLAFVVSTNSTLMPLWTSQFHFHLMALCGVGFWQAKRRGEGSKRVENLLPLVMSWALPLFTVVILGFTLPFLAPLCCAFVGATSYVAFRDIYLGQTANTPRVSQGATSSASGHV